MHYEPTTQRLPSNSRRATFSGWFHSTCLKGMTMATRYLIGRCCVPTFLSQKLNFEGLCEKSLLFLSITNLIKFIPINNCRSKSELSTGRNSCLITKRLSNKSGKSISFISGCFPNCQFVSIRLKQQNLRPE